MGNEQGSPYLQQKQQQQQTNANPTSPYDFESLIVIRGERRTGKSTLLTRMKGQNFNPSYPPTPGLEVYQFPWRLNSSHCNNVMISIWDVVEHSITQSNDQNPQKTLPDAHTIDTLKRANGLVIMIDERSPSSVALAEHLICEAPEECQVVVFSNFYGEDGVKPVVPGRLRSHLGRFSFIVGNLRTNLGLKALARWLQLPLLAAKRKMFADLFRAADNDLHALEDEFFEDARCYTSSQSALAKIEASSPKMQSYSYLDSKQQSQENKDNVSASSSQTSVSYSEPSKLERPSVFAEPIKRKKKMPFFNNTGTSYSESQNVNEKANEDDDEGFWSDDDGDASAGRTSEPLAKKSDLLRPNPMVQQTQPKKTMKQIIEENTVRIEHSNLTNENELTKKNLKRKRKKVHHENQQIQNDQIAGTAGDDNNENDNFFSSSGDEDVQNDPHQQQAEASSQQQQQHDAQNQMLQTKSNDTSSASAAASKQKTIFTTTLVIEEEDEEDALEMPAHTVHVIHQQHHNEIAKESQIESVSNEPTNAIASTVQDAPEIKENVNDEDGFWSDNEDDASQELHQNLKSEQSLEKEDDNDEEEPAIKPNPLVQNVKPRTNNYQNVIPHLQAKSDTQNQTNGADTDTLQENQLVQPTKNSSETPQQTKAPETTEKKSEDAKADAPPSAANDDDDFWNFEQPAANQQVVAAAIQHKKKKLRTTKTAATASNEVAKPKERPLVIPKSQVAQRTITVASGKTSYDQMQQKQQMQMQQIPVIPTTDLFSDLNEPENEFFPSQRTQAQTGTPIQSSQKVEPAQNKTVRKRKRVVKSAAGSSSKNTQLSVPGYDSV